MQISGYFSLSSCYDKMQTKMFYGNNSNSLKGFIYIKLFKV